MTKVDEMQGTTLISAGITEMLKVAPSTNIKRTHRLGELGLSHQLGDHTFDCTILWDAGFDDYAVGFESTHPDTGHEQEADDNTSLHGWKFHMHAPQIFGYLARFIALANEETFTVSWEMFDHSDETGGERLHRVSKNPLSKKNQDRYDACQEALKAMGQEIEI